MNLTGIGHGLRVEEIKRDLRSVNCEEKRSQGRGRR